MVVISVVSGLCLFGVGVGGLVLFGVGVVLLVIWVVICVGWLVDLVFDELIGLSVEGIVVG